MKRTIIKDWRYPTEKEKIWFERKSRHDSRTPVALIKCPLCGVEQYLGLHTLNDKGEVNPSVICAKAKDGCGFHEFVTLDKI